MLSLKKVDIHLLLILYAVSPACMVFRNKSVVHAARVSQLTSSTTPPSPSIATGGLKNIDNHKATDDNCNTLHQLGADYYSN